MLGLKIEPFNLNYILWNKVPGIFPGIFFRKIFLEKMSRFWWNFPGFYFLEYSWNIFPGKFQEGFVWKFPGIKIQEYSRKKNPGKFRQKRDIFSRKKFQEKFRKIPGIFPAGLASVG